MTDTADPMARYANFHPIYDREKFQETLTVLADLPGETPVFLVLDDGNEDASYAPATELQVTWSNGYERCSENDEEGAELTPFFIYPAQRPDGVAGEGTFYPVGTLADLRHTLAQLTVRPDQMFHRTYDASNDEDSFSFASELLASWWDGRIQVDEPVDGAVQALFIL